MNSCFSALVVLGWTLLNGCLFGQTVTTVKNPTRLDWKFVLSAKEAARLPADYQSTEQKFQLVKPAGYDASRQWPLLMFLSPGDAYQGWKIWEKPCTEEGYFFCDIAATSRTDDPPAVGARRALDVLDHLRREFRIDPQQTYLCGFSDSAELACKIAFALPEYFGGVICLSGGNSLFSLDYLRHHVQDRLSVVLVSGERDHSRIRIEKYLAPLMKDLGIRSRLWLVPDSGHDLPPTTVLREVQRWLEDDLPNRQKMSKAYPQLNPPGDLLLSDEAQAQRLLDIAKKEIKDPKRAWRGIALLQGILSRWPKTKGAEEARRELRLAQTDRALMKRVAAQGGAEERHLFQARAKALEESGQMKRALAQWQLLARRYPSFAEGKQAANKAKAVETALKGKPFLGLSVEGFSNLVKKVEPMGPADKGNVRLGDTIIRVGAMAIHSFKDLRQALQGHKPGEKLQMEVERDGKTITLIVTLGRTPS